MKFTSGVWICKSTRETGNRVPVFPSMRIAFTILFILLHDHLAAGEHRQQQPLMHGEDRMGDRRCSPEDIEVYQGATAPLPNGIPTYTVEVLNVCVSGCAVANIHVRCGWFSSARLINPRVFRRLQYDDCLVNDGAPLAAGESLSFQYANTFRYPLQVFSVSCY